MNVNPNEKPPLTAMEMRRSVYDQICAMIRQHGGIDGTVWTFINKPNPEITFMGMPIIVRED